MRVVLNYIRFIHSIISVIWTHKKWLWFHTWISMRCHVVMSMFFACLDEGVVTCDKCLYKTNKDDIDVGFILPHPLE